MLTTYLEWLTANESECRELVTKLHIKHSGQYLGIEAGELWHITYLKLSKITREVVDQEHLRRLVCITAINVLRDLGRQRTRRAFYFSKPMPPRARPLPGSVLETVASKEPSADFIAAVADDLAIIRSLTTKDPKMADVLMVIKKLTDQGIPASAANLSRHLQVPYKQMQADLARFRNFARNAVR